MSRKKVSEKVFLQSILGPGAPVISPEFSVISPVSPLPIPVSA